MTIEDTKLLVARQSKAKSLGTDLVDNSDNKQDDGSLSTSADYQLPATNNYFIISTSAVMPQRNFSGTSARSIVTV
jgi:hypothetical protein